MECGVYACPVSATCGGCEWLDVPYDRQLERKHVQLEELFADFDVPVEPVVGMDDPTRYRAKIMSPYQRGRHGKPRFGMYQRASHELVESSNCLVEDKAGRPILASIAELAQGFHIPAYDEETGEGLLRHAVVRVAQHTGQVMVTLVVNRKEFPRKKAFVKALRKRHPRISTVVFNVNTRKTNAVLGPLNMVAYGQGWIEDEACGCTFRIPGNAFYQTNPRATEVLYDLTAEMADVGRDDTMLDAYCGIGTIGIVAAKRTGCAVIGVESVPQAVEIAQDNARVNHVKRAQFVCADAGEFIEGISDALDVVVMDPPRAGASERFCNQLLASAPRRIVYVSCNPATQVRDIRLLQQEYHVGRIVPVDMFPHTRHIENVVCLDRR